MIYQNRISSIGLSILHFLSFGYLKRLQEEKRIQDEKNKVFVDTLFRGNYSPISKKHIVGLNQMFATWQRNQASMFLSATRRSRRYLSRLLRNPWENPFRVEIVKELPEDMEGYKVFIENAFTEPFPSTCDMDTWAVLCFVKSVMACNRIGPEESEKFLFHVIRHFANHEIVSGIILVTVYKRD